MKALIMLMCAVVYVSAGEPADSQVVTSAEQDFLLRLARTTLEKYVRETDIPHVDEEQLSAGLMTPRGCFVTLDKDGSGLRGCIGYLQPVKPLYRSIIDNTISAAVRDHRFRKVTADELDRITISISILTIPQPLAFTSPEDLLAKLVPGRDGVILKTKYGNSTYLPSVWDDLPDKRAFLSRLCMKHGAPADEWKKSRIEIQVYQAIKFTEEKRK